jgi:thioredoxin-dependent peroxiredoxin
VSRLEVGDKVPTFSLPADDGSAVSSTSLRGERYVIYFYPADDTPGCTKEACQFNDLRRAFTDCGVRVIGVSPDSPVIHRQFRKGHKLRFTLLSDEPKAVMERFGAYGKKQLYGRTVVGVIRSTFVVGPTGRVEHAFYGVRADGHARRVLSAVQA